MRYPTAANIGRAVVIVVCMVAAVYADRAVNGRTETEVETDTIKAGRAATTGDLLDAAMPSKVTQYEAPDTTVQECIQVPTWLADTPRSDSASGSTTSQRSTPSAADKWPASDSASGTSPIETPLPALSAGLSYDIIPTTEGRPILSVTRHEVRASTIDPQTGAMTTYNWDIERPDNRLSAFAEAGAMPLGAYAMTGGQYTRDLGRLDVWGFTLDTQVHAGAGQAWTTRGAGPTFRTGLSVGIQW